jgi:hypothetical protein
MVVSLVVLAVVLALFVAGLFAATLELLLGVADALVVVVEFEPVVLVEFKVVLAVVVVDLLPMNRLTTELMVSAETFMTSLAEAPSQNSN